MRAQPSHPFEILLVEDSPTDTELVTEALKEAQIPTHLSAVEDGAQAMRFLRRQNSYAHAPRPNLILLDLNLPRKEGREVLAEIKADPQLKMIPVIVLTTSQARGDVLRAYELQANCYITKPLQFREFTAMIRNLETFWLSVASLPSEP